MTMMTMKMEVEMKTAWVMTMNAVPLTLMVTEVMKTKKKRSLAKSQCSISYAVTLT